MSEASRSILVRYAVIVLALVAVYAGSLTHGFVYDDREIIVENRLLSDLGNIPRFFVTEDMTDTPTGYYRPITYTVFALERAAWGLNPLGYNVTSLLLHILAALVFFRVVAHLFRRENLAFASALLFALHPTATETVNFHAGGRNTLLCALFSLLSLLCYLKKRHLLSVCCFSIAIFCKEFALLLPVVFYCCDRREESHERLRWTSYLPYVCAATIYLILRSNAVTNGNLMTSSRLSDNLLLIPQLVAAYLKNLAFPFALKTLYDIDPEVNLGVLAVSLLLLTILAAGLFRLRQRRELLWGASIFLLFLLPVLNIFPLGTALMADRHAYFASSGFCIALGYVVTLLKGRQAVALLAVICLIYGAIDLQRSRYWKDEVSLFAQMTHDAPGMAVGFQNLGIAAYEVKDYPKASDNLLLAAGKKGQNGSMLNAAASLLWEMEQPERACAVLAKKIEYEPENPQPYLMISGIHRYTGDFAQASLYGQRALELDHAAPWNVAKRCGELQVQGLKTAALDPVRAERLFREALTLDPFYLPALLAMGGAKTQSGEPSLAAHYYRRAVFAAPLHQGAHQGLMAAYQLSGNRAALRQETERFAQATARAGRKETGRSM